VFSFSKFCSRVFPLGLSWWTNTCGFAPFSPTLCGPTHPTPGLCSSFFSWFVFVAEPTAPAFWWPFVSVFYLSQAPLPCWLRNFSKLILSFPRRSGSYECDPYLGLPPRTLGLFPDHNGEFSFLSKHLPSSAFPRV